MTDEEPKPKRDYTRASIGMYEDQQCLIEDCAAHLGLNKSQYVMACVAAASPDPMNVLIERDPTMRKQIELLLPRLRKAASGRRNTQSRVRGISSLGDHGARYWLLQGPDGGWLERFEGDQAITTDVKQRAHRFKTKKLAKQILLVDLPHLLEGFELYRGPATARLKHNTTPLADT